MRITLICLLLSFTTFSFSQNNWWNSENNESSETQNEDSTKVERNQIINHQPGEIKISKSSLIEKIIAFKAATIPPYSGPIMDGFRVQLFFDQSRNIVDKSRSKVVKIDSEIPTYVEYQAPNYLLLVGDFRSQLDAERLRAELLSEFPEAIIKEMKVYLPRID